MSAPVLTGPHPFDVDTAVQASGDGTFVATVTDRWHALAGSPNGGYLAALCARAAAATVPMPDPLVLSTSFLRPAGVGTAELRTRLLRAGRRTATAEVCLRQEGRDVVHQVATFTRLDGPGTPVGGPDVALARPPALPQPHDCVDLVGDASLPGVTITERVEYRVAQLPGWRVGAPTGSPEAALWLRLRPERDPDPLALALLVDAPAPVVLELGVPGSATAQLTTHVRARPAPGWLACRMATRHVAGGFHEEDLELWDATGRLVAQSRQLGALPTEGGGGA